MEFSALNRQVFIQQLENTEFEVLIIGGGITGAGIALDASSRGMKTALIEMNDFASGTSGRSTKLIHGGLRYLKQLEFGLVAEVGRERAIVHRNAPHLTHPEKMLLPITANGSLGKFTSRIAMWVYEWLANVKKEERFRWLNRDQTLAQEPMLERDDLLGSILFYEYRTDDARLTMEVMKTAHAHGAVALNYCKAESFIYKFGKICGVSVREQFSGKQFNINAKHIVNAAGPWVDEIDELDNKNIPHMLQITKGIHLVVDHSKIPVKESLYFDTHDKRMIFVIPREGKTYFGTTDTFYNGNIAEPRAEGADIDYLINCVNGFFPSLHFKKDDIESCWAGLRPLVKKPGKKPSEISRKDELIVSPSGLITIAGGKLTGYRQMARKVTDTIADNMQQPQFADCKTERIKLGGGDFSEKEKTNLMMKMETEGIAGNDALLLFTRFGMNCSKIIPYYSGITERDQKLRLLFAQLEYCIHHEMCLTPADFFVRRTAMVYFDKSSVMKYKESILQKLAALTPQHLSDLEIDLEKQLMQCATI